MKEMKSSRNERTKLNAMKGKEKMNKENEKENSNIDIKHTQNKKFSVHTLSFNII